MVGAQTILPPIIVIVKIGPEAQDSLGVQEALHVDWLTQ